MSCQQVYSGLRPLHAHDKTQGNCLLSVWLWKVYRLWVLAGLGTGDGCQEHRFHEGFHVFLHCWIPSSWNGTQHIIGSLWIDCWLNKRSLSTSRLKLLTQGSSPSPLPTPSPQWTVFSSLWLRPSLCWAVLWSPKQGKGAEVPAGWACCGLKPCETTV